MDSKPNIGFRVKTKFERPLPDLLKSFEGLSTGNVCDANGRMGAMDYHIKPLNSSWHFVGAAITVRARPVDNLIVYKALSVAQPGDVLVITNNSSTTASVFGDRVAAIAKALGIVAMVTDGVVRDLSGLLKVNLPVFSRGVNPNAPYKDGPGEINYPISCGNITVHPGDIVIGDGDGVVVVPLNDVSIISKNIEKVILKEKKMEEDIAGGRLIPDWITEILNEKGISIIE